jgi:uncharacterized protein with PQ loop repeat
MLLICEISSKWNYGAAFYMSSALDSLFSLLVICEFLALTLGPDAARPRRLTIYIAATLAAVYFLAGSIGKFFLAENAWWRGQQLFMALAAATLVVFVLLRQTLRLYWSRRTAAIARGMLIYLAAGLLLAFSNGRVEAAVYERIGQLSQLSYAFAVALWIAAFWRKPQELQPPTQRETNLVRSALIEGREKVEALENE